MSKINTLDWWLTHWSSVIRDIDTTEIAARDCLEACYVLKSAEVADVPLWLADLGEQYDSWLEEPVVTWCALDSVLESALGLTRASGFNPSVIASIRTLFRGLKKFEEDHDVVSRETLSNAAKRAFADRQRSLGTVEGSDIPADVAKVLAEVKYLLGQLFAPGIWNEELEKSKPRTGPGAVAEHLDHIERWEDILNEELRRVTTRRGNVSPLVYTSLLPGLSCSTHSEQDQNVTNCCRLVAVPKNRWKMRLITVEPAYCGFMQQYYRSVMIGCMCRHPATRHLIEALEKRADQQVIQRGAALAGSFGYGCMYTASSAWCTLDFRDASDLISYQQVLDLFPAHVTDLLSQVRSQVFTTKVVNPDTGKEEDLQGPINSYAGMGNATTFTLETCMFWAVFEAVRRVLQLPGKVYVYGDDVIVTSALVNHPSRLIHKVIAQLKWDLNHTKSYTRPGGLFRESCGIQAWNGHNVTYTGFVGYADNAAGWMGITAKLKEMFLTSTLAKLVLHETGIPNFEGAPAGGVCVDLDWLPRTEPAPVRRNRKLFRTEYKVWGIHVPKREADGATGRSLLLAWFLGYEYSMWKTLGKGRRAFRAGPFYMEPVPRRLSLERRWMPSIVWGTLDEGSRR